MATLAKLGQAKFGVEPSFGTDPAALTYVDCKENLDTSGLKIEAVKNDDWKQHLENEPHYIGVKNGSTISLNKNWRTRTSGSTLPSAGPTATTAVALMGEYPDAVLIGQALGGMKIFADGGAQAFTAWSALDVTKKILTVTSSADYTVGEAIMIKTGNLASNPTVTGWEIGYITATDTGEITVRDAFVRAYPISGADDVFAGVTCYTCDAFQVGSLGATIQGQAATDYYKLNGVRPTKFSAEANPSEFVTLSFDYSVADWTRTTGTAPVHASLVAGDKRQVLGGKCTLVPTGGSAISLDVSKISFDSGIEVSQSKALTSLGVADAFLVGHDGTLTLDPVWSSEDLFTSFTAQTLCSATFHCGDQPGKVFSIHYPACIVDEFPGLTDRDGKKCHKLVLRPVRFADNANAWDDAKAENKSCYIAMI